MISCRDWALGKVANLLEQFSGPCYLVTFSRYCKHLDCGEYSYQVGCCEECNLKQLDILMKDRGYCPMESYQATMYGKTKMRVELAGSFQIGSGPLELT